MSGRGLLSVEDTVMSERFALYYCLKDHKDALMRKVRSCGFVKTPDTDSTFTPDAFKNHLKITHFQNWRDKLMHGQYVCSLHGNNSAHSFERLLTLCLVAPLWRVHHTRNAMMR